MERFIERHRGHILGVLSGFDRILFRGTLGTGLSSSASDSKRERKFTEAAGFNLAFREPVPEEVVPNLVYWTQNFLTFATDHPNALTQLELRRKNREIDKL